MRLFGHGPNEEGLKLARRVAQAITRPQEGDLDGWESTRWAAKDEVSHQNGTWIVASRQWPGGVSWIEGAPNTKRVAWQACFRMGGHGPGQSRDRDSQAPLLRRPGYPARNGRRKGLGRRAQWKGPRTKQSPTGGRHAACEWARSTTGPSRYR